MFTSTSRQRKQDLDSRSKLLQHTLEKSLISYFDLPVFNIFTVIYIYYNVVIFFYLLNIMLRKYIYESIHTVTLLSIFEICIFSIILNKTFIEKSNRNTILFILCYITSIIKTITIINYNTKLKNENKKFFNREFYFILSLQIICICLLYFILNPNLKNIKLNF